MGKTIRVLVVDDSAFVRVTISGQLSTDPGIEVVGVARNGLDALEKLHELHPDVVTLDVDMPKMDGLSALERIMSECPTPVLMISSLTAQGSAVTLKALELGAVDFFLKPAVLTLTKDTGFNATLRDKVKEAAGVNVGRLHRKNSHGRRPESVTQLPASPVVPASFREFRSSDRMVAIASSTGGPRALYEVMPHIPSDIPAAIVMVQHMPVGFTKSLAERLNELCQIRVREAKNGDRLHPGLALMAPGGYHMIVEKDGTVGLTQSSTHLGLRPAADLTMESAAAVYGSRCLGVVLTGMGSDGTLGAGAIKANGGEVISEAEETCVVYGMPRSVVEAGFSDRVVPLTEVAGEIVAACRERIGMVK
jgi:two-component system chemotaxis response regulator CheB